ncbi:Peptidyl-dipeptidase A [Anaeromyxobacter dehalogenans 2CP-1]|uniref:Peptidyl-dipeptidase A n=1 Tax=Anaeromyxobacter dehalogenans (strain ATCC BAA-258 / DSM 21875 / 2CP-1) TaxID=455488 RepID=B8J791_ANAD2|nr:M2 family metallopeptidase [Anaeromyxobacter dehalogenans]ACL65281.1 Peptidyl-dipeptidase A [Anaeromyxobacter dehalogenans 2CP-1]
MTTLPVLQLAAVLLAATPSAPAAPPQPAAAAKPTAADAKAFVGEANAELKKLWIRWSTAEWIKSTYITDDTERNAAALNEDQMAYLTDAIRGAVRFQGVGADPDTERMLMLLRIASPLPAPSDAAQRAELAQLAAKLEGMYGKGKWCGAPGSAARGAEKCRDLQDLEQVMAKSRDYDALLDAWTGWHTISRDMRPLYERMVTISNAGAREIGFRDLGDLWRSGYDMPPDAFEADTDRLWAQVKPFYEELHCYVRSKLQKAYGKARVPDGKPIPAHLLGNMWAQDWANLYPLVEPYHGQPSLDVDAALRRQKTDPIKMVKLGEAFFTSLGFEPLPKTFWERSQFTKPRDRDVVCHASAWDVTYSADLRIKMCIRPTEEDLVTIHHELGHNFYQRAYVHLPVLFQNGANDGFHEAIGDAIALSITPGYLKQVGLIQTVPKDEKGVVNVQMKRALEKVAFLPFGKLIDQWRWDVFSGKTPASRYNAAWWELRRKYQGVDAPVSRSEADFDPGAKYHVPANVPYTRYFLAHVYQFQFHKALCEAAGWKGPLHECSIYGSKAAGKKLDAMLAMGASRPWPEAYAALTGSRQADASAMLEYFAPLRAWLRKQIAGQSCGW